VNLSGRWWMAVGRQVKAPGSRL